MSVIAPDKSSPAGNDLASSGRWTPAQTLFRNLLLLIPVLSLALAVWLGTTLLARIGLVYYDPGVFLLALALFLTLMLSGLLIYLAWCAFTMSYTIDAGSLRVQVGGVRHVIPLHLITEIHPPNARVAGRPLQVEWKGLVGFLPGYLVGEGYSPQFGRVVAASASPRLAQVAVTTPHATFTLSPQDHARFIQTLDEGRKQAAQAPSDENATVYTERFGPSKWGALLWSDRLARGLMLAGLAACAALFGYLSLVYGELPTRLPLHWNAQAQVDRIGDPTELLRLPLFGLAIWLANTVMGWWALPRERAATLFLLGGALAAQIVFAVGALTIVLRAV